MSFSIPIQWYHSHVDRICSQTVPFSLTNCMEKPKPEHWGNISIWPMWRNVSCGFAIAEWTQEFADLLFSNFKKVCLLWLLWMDEYRYVWRIDPVETKWITVFTEDVHCTSIFLNDYTHKHTFRTSNLHACVEISFSEVSQRNMYFSKILVKSSVLYWFSNERVYAEMTVMFSFTNIDRTKQPRP